MEFQIIWFVLWGVLWAVYFMLDGFDFGVGILSYFLGKTDAQRRQMINTIGPVWDGNEVWLITAGGATFAAFPTTYALMFSYLYTPLLLILFALIFRGVALEFRSKGDSTGWRAGWDLAIFLGSLLPTVLFGVAFGNIFQGLPMDANGYHGSLFTLLNPYGLLAGVLFTLLFLMHGSLWLAVKTDGEVQQKSEALALKLWIPLLVVAGAFLVHTYFATKLYDNYFKAPLLFALPLLAVIALVGIRVFISKGDFLSAFYSSCLCILMVVFTGIAGLYPNLIPSSISPEHSLTIFNTSSSEYTLKIMTVVAVIFVPIVIAYQAWVFKVFKGRLSEQDVIQDKEAY